MWGEAALEDLVPPDRAAAIRVEYALDPADETALQLVLVTELLALDDLLRGGALLPPLLRRFVAADVDECVREDVHDLMQQALEERKGRLARREHLLGDAPRGANLERSRHVGVLRVRREGREAVARHLDLRQHGHAALGRVHDDLTR